MSTHATIGIVNKNGQVEFVYLHQDGHPEQAGEILNRLYGDDATRNLIQAGRVAASEELHVEMARRDDYLRSPIPADYADYLSKAYPKNYSASNAVQFLERSLKMHAHYAYLRHEGQWMMAARVRDDRESPWHMTELTPLHVALALVDV